VIEITDDEMREMLTQTKSYSLVLLKGGPNYGVDGHDEIVWEHGRRNFALRADGVLAIVARVLDDGPWCGVGIFDASEEAVVELMDDDPGVRAGVFEYEVHPVRSFPGSALPA
jgi:hypothetical protein